MNEQIIISDPGDEINHIYEDLPHQSQEQNVMPSEGVIEQQEGINTDPSYMNGYD